ncbi:hypothetical protein D3C80_1341270 [compost metagenome]
MAGSQAEARCSGAVGIGSPPARPHPRTGMGPFGRQGPSGQVQGPSGRLRENGLGAGKQPPGPVLRRHPDPARPAPGQCRAGSRGPEEVLWRQGPVRQPDLQAAAQRHRRRHRPQRRRQVDHVQADHRPGNARRRHHQGRRDRQAGLCRPVARRPEAGRNHLASHLGRHRRDDGRQARDQHPRLCRQLQLQGRRPAEEGRPTVRR